VLNQNRLRTSEEGHLIYYATNQTEVNLSTQTIGTTRVQTLYKYVLTFAEVKVHLSVLNLLPMSLGERVRPPDDMFCYYVHQRDTNCRFLFNATPAKNQHFFVFSSLMDRFPLPFRFRENYACAFKAMSTLRLLYADPKQKIEDDPMVVLKKMSFH